MEEEEEEKHGTERSLEPQQMATLSTQHITVLHKCTAWPRHGKCYILSQNMALFMCAPVCLGTWVHVCNRRNFFYLFIYFFFIFAVIFLHSI